MFFYVVSIIQALSFLIGLFFFQRIRNPWVRWLILYIGNLCLIELALEFIPTLETQATLTRVYYCLAFPVEYALYVCMFREKLAAFGGSRYWLMGTVGVLATFGLYNALLNQQNSSAATDVFSMVAVMSLILSLLYFWSLLQSKEVIYLLQEPLFWIATALLFFYAGSIIATGFYHAFYKKSAHFAVSLFKVNLVLGIFRSVLYSVAFLVAARKLPYG
ncbi:hypothetical protein F5984_11765 [Rudanella paleaurantiibacter]|uniref:Histidine kinase N-terminal 7TM region domain-containing protein n=1 Tax=Rudanella paleaurantiibacter TaxID=2614655 RepID=A0A7J5U119_9BACT|nr:hypothetical protein [Rudanella paleaurantiibacter]KAB7731458.1 hypothetical protein F5984_11765 [Rudanella paleaurantiibacter]